MENNEKKEVLVEWTGNQIVVTATNGSRHMSRFVGLPEEINEEINKDHKDLREWLAQQPE